MSIIILYFIFSLFIVWYELIIVLNMKYLCMTNFNCNQENALTSNYFRMQKMQNCVTFALLISQDSRKKLTLSSEIKLNNLDLPMWTYMLIVYLSTSGYDPKGTQNVFISIYVKISCYIFFVVARWRGHIYIFLLQFQQGGGGYPPPK